MASDFSSECTEGMTVLDDEKEEGELSLDDVSSSEEGHVNYGPNQKCFSCPQPQCAPCCTFSARYVRSKHLHQKDAEQGKENHHLIKDTGYSVDRHTSSTLQEKNDDLIPISSDSDMELVGLTKRKHRTKSNKVKKKKKKRRPHALEKQDEIITNEMSENVTIKRGSENVTIKRGSASSKENRLFKQHRRENSPIYETRTSPRRHRSPVRVRPLEKKIKSPIAHRSNDVRKHKKLKSPESLINPLHKKNRKHSSPSKCLPSPSCDIQVIKLLKKVRQLDMVGTAKNPVSNKAKEHGSSLKDKLNNILKPSLVNNENAVSEKNENGNEEAEIEELEVEDVEDEEEEKKTENGEEDEDLNILRQKALETKQSKTNVVQEPLNVEADIKGNCVNDDEDDDDDEDLKLRLIALQSAVYKKYHNREKTKKNKKTLPPRCESPFSESFINNISLAEDALTEDVTEKSSDSVQPSDAPLTEDFNNSIEDMELDSEVERDANSDEAPYSPTDLVSDELVLEAEQLGIDTTDVSLININSKSFTQHGSYLSNEKEKRPIYSSISTASAKSDSDFRSILNEQDRNFATERPYSPSDVPIFDPDLTDSLLPQNETFNTSFPENMHLDASARFYSNHQKEMEIEIIDDLPETDIDGSPLVPMEKDSSSLYHIPEHLSYQMLHPSYQPLYLSNMHEDVNRIPIMNHTHLMPQSVLRVSQQMQQEMQKSKTPVERVLQNSLVMPINEFANSQQHCQYPGVNFPVADQSLHFADNNPYSQQAKENVSVHHSHDQQMKEKVLYANSVQQAKEKVLYANSVQQTKENALYANSVQQTKENALYANSVQQTKEKALYANSVQQAKEKVHYPNSVQQTKENVSLNHEEEPVNSKGKKSGRKRRKKSKRILIEAEMINKDVDRTLRLSSSSENSSVECLEIVPAKRLEVPEDQDSAKRLKTSEDRAGFVNSFVEIDSAKRNYENQERERKDESKESDSRIIGKSSERESGEETRQMEPRRKSIDEDEEALRAILLASMGKRTRSPKTNSKIKSSEIDNEMSNKSSCSAQKCQENLNGKKGKLVDDFGVKDVHAKVHLVSQAASSRVASSRVASPVSSPVSSSVSSQVSSRIASSQVAPFKIASSNVASSKVASSQVVSSQVLPSKVTPSQVLPSKVTSSKATTSQVASSKVASSNVTSLKATSSQVASSQVASSQVASSRLASPQVVSSKVAPSQVATPKSASLTTPSKITPSQPVSSKVQTSKISPSKITLSKISPSKITLTKSLPSKISAKVSPSKIVPTKVASTSAKIASASTKLPSTSAKILPLSAKTPSTKLLINETVNSILGKRKLNSVLLGGTQKKVAKRTVIPASTRVVNNAKRYQNSLLQKKLNLQKTLATLNSRKVIANKSLRVLNLNQNTRSISPNVPSANQSERFIISLKSDSESDSESERRNTNVAVTKNSSVEKSLTIPTTEFERSVDQFLRDVRKKQEIAAAASKQPVNSSLAKTLPPPENAAKGKKSAVPATPLAVRHLPASQQEEYHRLKQQIVEREKLKLQRTTISQQTSNIVPSGPLSPTGSTTCSNSKTASSVIKNNVLETDSFKTLQNNPPSPNISSLEFPSPEKPNFTIEIRNNLSKTSAKNVEPDLNIQEKNVTEMVSAETPQNDPPSTNISSLASQTTIQTKNTPPTKNNTPPTKNNNTPSSAKNLESDDLEKSVTILAEISKNNSFSSNSTSSVVTPQEKPSLTIQIKNTPTRISAKNVESNLNVEEKSKQAALPKLRILTCEQINRKLLQIQVTLKDEGRRVIVGDPISPVKGVSYSDARNKNNAAKISTKESNDSFDDSLNMNESNLDASIIILSDSRDKTRNLKNSSENRLNKNIDSSSALSQKNSGVSSNDPATSNARQNATISGKEKRGEKETVAAKRQVSKGNFSREEIGKQQIVGREQIGSKQQIVGKEKFIAKEKMVSKQQIGKQQNVAKKANVSKKSTIVKDTTSGKASTVSREPTAAKESSVSKQTIVEKAIVSKQTIVEKAIVSKQPIVEKSTVSKQQIAEQATVSKQSIATKEATISKQPTATKEAAISKEPIATKEATVSKQSIVEKAPISKQIAAKESTVSKEPISTKEVGKQPIAKQLTNVSEQPIVAEESVVSKQTTCEKESTAIEETICEKESSVSKETTAVKKSTGKESGAKDTTYKKSSVVERLDNVDQESGKEEDSVQIEKVVTEKSDVSIEKNDEQKSKSDKEKSHDTMDVIKSNVQAEVEKVFKLGDDEMKKKLEETEHELVNKRYVVLDDLAEVSKSLRQWELEKDVQANLADEVKKLREQLREAEEKLQEQKDAVANMGSKVSAVHEKMNIGRKECFRLSKICTGLGSRLYGQKYKVPETGVQMVNNRLKEVAQHTSQLCRKRNEKKKRVSVTSENSSKKESDSASSESVKSTGQLERRVSFESVSSCDKDSNSESPISGDNTTDDQTEADKDKDNSSQNETESSNRENMTSCNSASSVLQSKNKESRDGEDDPKSSREVNNLSSRRENTESDVTCHNLENSVHNRMNGLDNQSKKTNIRPYESILDHIKTTRNSQSDGILCPYELMGSCRDADCQFLHHTPSHRG